MKKDVIGTGLSIILSILIGGGIVLYALHAGHIELDIIQDIPKDTESTSRSADTNFNITQLANRVTDTDNDLVMTSIYDDNGDAVDWSTIGGGGSSTALAEWVCPADGCTVTYTSSTTVTLASLPVAISSSPQLVYLRQIKSDNTSATYVNGDGTTTLTISGAVVTVHGNDTPLAAGDAYELGYNALPHSYDSALDLVKIQEQSPLYDRRTDGTVLVDSGTPQEIDASFTDMGSEIDMRGYTDLAVFIILDINSSTNVEFRILHKWESGGSEEFRTINQATVGSNLSLLDLYDYQVNADADQAFKLEIDTGGTTPYIQIQVKDSADGTGQIDAAYIVKNWH